MASFDLDRRSLLRMAACTVLFPACAPLAQAQDNDAPAPGPKPEDKFKLGRDWTDENPISLPDPAWELLKTRFKGIQRQARLERLWHGLGAERALWLEGPIWMGDWGSLIFSDVPNNRTLRWLGEDGAVSVFQRDSGYANGHARDKEGRLIAFEQSPARVRRLEHDGTWTTLIEGFEGKKLNGPNDGAVHRDGSIWFTDPGYGLTSPFEGSEKRTPELPTRVYRLASDGTATVAADGPMRRPNGLCFSPDFKRCYVVDSGVSDGIEFNADIIAFDVADDRLKNGQEFADFIPGTSDGIRCDADGNVWCSWGWGGPETNGVRVHAPDGDLVAVLHTPEIVSNLCFGGPKGNRLFMTGSSSLYAIYVNTTGVAL